MKDLTNSDRKAIALAAFLFYAERDFPTELIKCAQVNYWTLRITYEDVTQLPVCPMLHHPSFRCQTVRVGYSDKVTFWEIPIDEE